MSIASKCLAGVLVCGLPSLAQHNEERLVAVVDVFSGRPNPRILLRPDAEAASARAEHAFVAGKLASACEGEPMALEKAPAYPARLGYRGVLILRQVGQDSYIPVAQVYRGVVRLDPREASARCRAPEGSALYAKDLGAEFENRMLAAAFDRGLLSRELRDAIRDTLSKF